MIRPRDLLLNDGTLVQVGRHEMRRRADNLDAALVRLVVGLRTLEGGQEAVVDVDDASGQRVAQHGGEDLHVPREHDKLNVVLADEVQDLGLLLRLRVLGDGEMVEGDAVALGEGREIRMVGHDEGHLDGELVHAEAVQQVVEAVANLGDHDEDAGLARGRLDLVVHAILGGELVKGLDEVRRGGDVLIFRLGGREVHAHEEALGDGVTVLLQVGNVVVLGGEDAGDGVDDARTVGAGQGEDVILDRG